MSNIKEVSATLSFLKPGLLIHKFLDHAGTEDLRNLVYSNDAGYLVLPAGNIEAMCTNVDIGTSIARILAKRKGGTAGTLSLKDAPQVLSGNILLNETEYPLLRNGKPFGFSEDVCKPFKRTVAVKAKGGFSRSYVTSVLVEPPLEVIITMRVNKNPHFDAESLRELFETAGLAVRLGTYRKRFGAFMVKEWQVA